MWIRLYRCTDPESHVRPVPLMHISDGAPMLQGIFRLALLLTILAVPDASAQQPINLPRMAGSVELDGYADEAAWQGVAPLDLTMYEPISGGVVTERTEIRVAYDDDFIYVAGSMFDTEPEQIRANTLYRDRYSGDDTFAIVLDTFNDNENALWFFTTPTGVRFDYAVSDDADGGGGGGMGSAVNRSWNTFWDVVTKVDERGWFAEMRIPFSSLSFQEVDGSVDMGMIVYRYISRKGERHVYPPIRPNWDLGFAKPSQAAKVRLEGIRSQKPLYVTPYVTGGSTGLHTLNESDTAYRFDSEFTRQAGVDFKYALTSNLTLDATINTDFAQVEADDQQVNLSRFSLFFPEKRQFFQERSALFEFSTGRRDRLFHSRQIGINDGQTVRILGGGRLVGRVGEWDIGLINMQTEAQGNLPAENFGVLRLRRRVVNDQSYAGVMGTSRLGDDGSWNAAYGADAVIRLGDFEILEMKWAQTLDDALSDANGVSLTGSAYGSVQLQRRTDIGWSYRTGASFAGRDYLPGVGFVQRTDYWQYSWDVQYGWLSPDQAKLRTHDGSTYGSVYFRNADGSLESLRAGGSWDFAFKSSASARISANYLIEDLLEEVSFPGETTVPAGRYGFVESQARYEMPEGSLFRGQFDVRAGTFYDGTRYAIGLEPTWNVNRFIELAGDYEFTRLEFPERDQQANIHLVGVRSQIGLNTKLSLNAFVQYNTAADIVASNIRFRYNMAEGNDLWVVYTENLNTDRFRDSPALPVSRNRTLLLKYTHTFIR